MVRPGRIDRVIHAELALMPGCRGRGTIWLREGLDQHWRLEEGLIWGLVL
jgi:hypothetical protein